MPLTDTAVRTAKATPKRQKLFDGGGLYLEVTPEGGKRWRLKYRFDGKEKLLSLGVYPEVSLKQARERREVERRHLAEGIDPSQHRKAFQAARVESAANSFEAVALEWFAKNVSRWSESHSSRLLHRLKVDVFPSIGARPVSEVTPRELLVALKRVEDRGAVETAHRALQSCNQVMRYAVQTDRAERNPFGDLRGGLKPVEESHFAAVTDPKEAAELLRVLDGYHGTLTVKCALRLAPLVFVRPGELRQAEWAHVDFEAAEWRFQASKTATDHIVPLARQAIEILKEIHALTGHGRYVFPSVRTEVRPMSNNAVLAAMRSMGIDTDKMSGHGFRAMARTMIDEQLGVPQHLIEHQLAHRVKDANGSAYNRTKHLADRKAMMQRWADYLDQIKIGGNVIPFVKQSV